MTTATDHEIGLGLAWPWNVLGDAALRADNAKRAQHAAQVAGDFDAAARHEFDHMEAIADWYKVREECARLFLYGLRCALEMHSTAIQTHLDPNYRAELDNTQWALVDAEARLDAIEDAVVTLETRKGVTT